MMKNKRGYLIILVSLVIFVAGCNTGDNNKVSGSFVGGDNGLILSFVENEPPESVLDANAEDFFIKIMLENEGEDDVEAGEAIVTLSGISKDQFQIDSLTKSNDNLIFGVRKDRNNVIEGSQEEVSFNANYKGDLKQDFSATITADICYDYETRTLSNICLRKDVARRDREGECFIDEEKSIENSGAPVQVTLLRERRAGNNELSLTFEISNIGAGEVFGKGAFSSGKCDQDKVKENLVHVSIEPVSDVQVRCDKFANTGEGDLRLTSEKKATVTCSVNTLKLQENAFEDPVNINLDYVYKERISKGIIVENAI